MNNYILSPHALAAYAHHLQETEHSPATIANYLRDVRRFLAWLADAPVTEDSGSRWKEALQAQGLAVTTINAKLAALNGFFGYLGWNNCRVRFLKMQRRLFRDAGRVLQRQEYERLVTTAIAQRKTRLALVMETLCASGMRVSELCAITVQAARSGRAELRLKGKVRVILLPQKLCRKLLHYARQQKIASGEIFLTAGGKSLSRRQIWSEMKRLALCAGVSPQKVFPHNLRHLFATVFYAASQDIVRLADLLGHSSIETTRIYLMTTGEEHLRCLRKMRLVL